MKKNKTKHKSKYALRKPKRYAPGGMYENNTIGASGQQGAGTTESIVYEEANPQVLEAAKNAKLKNDETLAQNASNQASEISATQAADEAAMEQDAAQRKAKAQSIDSTVGKSIDTLTDGGKSADVLGNMKDKFVNTKQGIKTAGMKIFRRKAIKEAKAKAAKSIAGEQFGNVARQKSAEQVSSMLADQAGQKGQEILLDQAQQKAFDYTGGFGVDQASKFALDQGKDLVVDKAKDLAIDKGKDLLVDKAKDVAVDKGKDLLVDKTKEQLTKKATEKLVEKGTETALKKGAEVAVTEGAKGAAASSINPNPYATAANLVGTAVSMGADDGDATTWNAGEASGDILSKAGSYAGYGSMIGSVVPGVGNAVGAVVGGVIGAGVATWQGLANRKKARKEKAALEAKAQKKADETNAKTTKSFTSQVARTNAAEMKAKTYSGYDLGNNVNARKGGFAPLPGYNYGGSYMKRVA